MFVSNPALGPKRDESVQGRAKGGTYSSEKMILEIELDILRVFFDDFQCLVKRIICKFTPLVRLQVIVRYTFIASDVT